MNAQEACQLARNAEVEGDQKTAALFYRYAADLGDVTAQVRFGEQCMLGKGIDRDYRLAAQYLGYAARSGSAAAQNSLGILYFTGNGVGRDDARAALLFGKAAEQGYESALFHLGICHELGRGVAKDPNAAIRLYRQASDKGHTEAAYSLGRLYELGEGVPQDLDEAEHYLGLAADRGYARARAELDKIRALRAEYAAHADAERAAEEAARREEQDAVQTAAEREAAIAEALAELDALIGLQGVKQQVQRLVSRTRVNQVRRARGMAVPSTTNHCVFTGNPGTGKTTVARIMAKVFKGLGVVSKGQLVETDRSGLVGEYVGHTAVKTKAVIDEALGGVLFIDEAYTLAGKGSQDFGTEAIETLLKMMEDHRDDLVVIAAGYEREMRDFIGANPGLESRFQNFIPFEDYRADELLAIFEGLCTRNGFVLDAGASKALRSLFEDMVAHKTERFANGREARKVFDWIVEAQADRLVAELESLEDAETTLLAQICEADVRCAARRLGDDR